MSQGTQHPIEIVQNQDTNQGVVFRDTHAIGCFAPGHPV